MKRNAFLITALLFCFAGFAVAAEHKKQSAPKPQHEAQQTEKARDNADGDKDGSSSNKNGCDCEGGKSNSKHRQQDPEGDPEAPQNQVEYRAGG